MTTTTGVSNHNAQSGASTLQLKVFTSPTRPIGGSGDRTFSPITSSFIFGERQGVLVDAQFIREDVEALGDMIADTGRALTTIFITHGHGDHYFGAGRLVERFPGARVVATPGVIAYIATHQASDLATWSAMFGDAVVPPTATPSPFEGEIIELEGQNLRLIEVGQGDISPTAVLHVPALDAVIAGDVAYNQIHQMLGFSGPAEWEKWITSLDTIEGLRPRIVVAGHKKPEADDEASRVLNQSRAYIRDFLRISSSARSVAEIVDAMRAKYPDHGNLTTLLYSADAAFKARFQQGRAPGIFSE